MFRWLAPRVQTFFLISPADFKDSSSEINTLVQKVCILHSNMKPWLVAYLVAPYDVEILSGYVHPLYVFLHPTALSSHSLSISARIFYLYFPRDLFPVCLFVNLIALYVMLFGTFVWVNFTDYIRWTCNRIWLCSSILVHIFLIERYLLTVMTVRRNTEIAH